MKHRYFQIGFNRAGTSSLAELLERQGLVTIHHDVQRDGSLVNVALKLEENLKNGAPPLQGFDDIDAFTDIEYVSKEHVFEGNRYFREIAKAYPEMKFVLNLRPKEDWLKSRLAFGDYPDRWMACHSIDKSQLIEMWSEHWDRQIADVRAELPSNRLLEYDIVNPNHDQVAEFFGLDGSATLRVRNKSVNGRLARSAQKILPGWLVRLVPNHIKTMLKDI